MKKHPSEPPPPPSERSHPAPPPAAAVIRGDADIADLKRQVAEIQAELAIYRRRLGVRRS